MNARVTISLPQRLLRKLDHDSRGGNRSAIVAAALDRFYGECADDRFALATIAYYQGRSEEERVESAAIARASAKAATRVLRASARVTARRARPK